MKGPLDIAAEQAASRALAHMKSKQGSQEGHVYGVAFHYLCKIIEEHNSQMVVVAVSRALQNHIANRESR